jgi:hypothetical protein
MAVLQWAVEHGCPWNPGACAKSAKAGGHVEVAQWVRAQLTAEEEEEMEEEEKEEEDE